MTTLMRRLTSETSPLFFNFGVGFDRLFRDLDTLQTTLADQTNYPPHNLKQIDEDLFELEIAVAGFRYEDLSITKERHRLTLSAKKPEEGTESYLHRGIGLRSFTKTFALAETIEVDSASLEHGLLKVRLRNVIPEEDRPKTIHIQVPSLLQS